MLDCFFVNDKVFLCTLDFLEKPKWKQTFANVMILLNIFYIVNAINF